MDNLSRFLIGIVAIMLIFMSILSTSYINKKNLELNSTIAYHDSRKESLIAKQEEIQALIIDLNKTLQDEVTKQAILESQVTNITGQIVSKPLQVNPIVSSTPSTTSSSTSSSSTTSSQSTRVTRAS